MMGRMTSHGNCCIRRAGYTRIKTCNSTDISLCAPRVYRLAAMGRLVRTPTTRCVGGDGALTRTRQLQVLRD
jgi:hypothetical protein